jgi:hypothetical protein
MKRLSQEQMFGTFIVIQLVPGSNITVITATRSVVFSTFGFFSRQKFENLFVA